LSDQSASETAQCTDHTEHTECAVCGYEPDADRVPPYYVFSLSDEDIDDEYAQSYPFGGSLSVPFACSDECWLDAQDDPELVADGGTERPDPTEDLAACSKCGVHIGFGGDEYCDGCAREIGAKPPLRRCEHCGQRAPEEHMTAVDVSGPDEYYPEFIHFCPSCGGDD